MYNNDDSSSSDSSIDDHFKSSDKINFNSSFFNVNNRDNIKDNSKSDKLLSKCNDNNEEKSKSNDTNNDCDDDDDDDDDFISDYNNDISSTALLAEVMKNLEKINNNTTIINSSNASPSVTPSTSRQSTILNKTPTKTDLLTNEINDLLLRGESDLGSSNYHLFNDNNDIDDDTDKSSRVTSNYSIPKEGVNITLPDTGLIFNRRKKHCGIDLIDELRKKLNRRIRSNQMFIHKVGLLCWLSHGFHLNKQLNDPELMSIVMSLIPQKSYPMGRVDLNYLEQFTKWFKSLIKLQLNNSNKYNKSISSVNDFSISITKDLLIERLKDKKVLNYRELVLLYICALRSIGINCRLIVSLYPPNIKPKHDNLFTTHNSIKHNDNNDEIIKKRKKISVKDQSTINNRAKSLNDNNNQSDDDVKSMKIIPKNSKQARKIASDDAKKYAANLIRTKYMKKNNDDKKFHHNTVDKKFNDDETIIKSPVQIRQLRSRTILNKDKKNITSGSSLKTDDDDDDDDEVENKNNKHKVKSQRKNINIKATKKLPNSKSNKSKCDDDDDDDIDRRVLSPVDDTEYENKNNIENIGLYYLWAEVYVESEDNWICVSIPDDKIHCVTEIYKKLPTPVLYIIAFNSLGKIKDVTRRYCNNWLTVTRKQRIDDKWWNKTLSPWIEARTAISKAEDESLAQREIEQPIPKSISECKGHPLYALTRHLLKFEALYPPECVPLGHLKNGEAIYSRHCVHTLRSRETWLKQARVVKPAQEPYKIVKSMPKYDKLSGQMMKGQPLELFGYWQTMDYVPPEAKNGKVPRNEYGNVDLFQECMLPKGTVHIDLPGLFRVAKKLDIDCVAAVVGFNFGGRGAMPMTHGYVVCKEYEDTLRVAWEEEQINAAARAKDKRDKRIWGNWRKLIRGLLIREKIIAKYELSQDNHNDGDGDDDDDDDKNNKLAKRTKNNDKKIAKKKKI